MPRDRGVGFSSVVSVGINATTANIANYAFRCPARKIAETNAIRHCPKGSTRMMHDRFNKLDLNHLSVEQQALYDRLVAGPRQGVRGPMAIWLHAPAFAERAASLGDYCRFENSLGLRLTELAILVTVKHWRAKFAWSRHLPLALEAGIAPEVVEKLLRGAAPISDRQDESIAHIFLKELLRTGFIQDQTWVKVAGVFDEHAVIDLTGIAGYYSLVAMTLNTATIGSEEDDPFS